MLSSNWVLVDWFVPKDWFAMRLRFPILVVLSCAIAVVSVCLPLACSKRSGPFEPKPGTSYDATTGPPMEIISRTDGAEMVLVPAGSFYLGDPDSLPRMVSLKAFYIDKFEVTNRRYEAFLSATGQRGPTIATADSVGLDWPDGRCPKGREDCPVVLVSYEDAAAFAAWAGKRLPTQEQWEYAARGPKSTVYPRGNSKLSWDKCNLADRLAGEEIIGRAAWDDWYSRWSRQDPVKRNAEAVAPVGLFPDDVSVFGCRDMGGSVREWCVKKARPNGYGLNSDHMEPVPSDSPVVCGGSWLVDAGRAQSWRHEATAPGRYADVGFRCVVPADHPAIRALARPQQ